jgi:hypothetical protein
MNTDDQIADCDRGGRWPYRAPAAPVPELPVAEFEAPEQYNYE